jgi:exosortase/archaeosortase family protein
MRGNEIMFKHDTTLEYLRRLNYKRLNIMAHQGLNVGIISREDYMKRTIAIAKGKYKPSENEPKIWGFVLGFLALQTINIIRIISLFYVGDLMLEHLDMMHRQIWPILLNISMILVFGGWLFYTITHSAESS